MSIHLPLPQTLSLIFQSFFPFRPLTKPSRTFIMAQINGPFLLTGEVGDQVHCAKLYHGKTFFFSVSFQGHPACGCIASAIHFWLTTMYQVNPSINQPQVYPLPSTGCMHLPPHLNLLPGMSWAIGAGIPLWVIWAWGVSRLFMSSGPQSGCTQLCDLCPTEPNS